MYKPHTHCRACGYAEPSGPPGIKSVPSGEKLLPVMDLGMQPMPNNFCAPGEEREGFAPLQVLFCPRCTLAQLSVTVRPEILYRNYAYVTSKSRTMNDHFNLLWQMINLECHPESVVEIGSNDGDFLAYARAHGATAVCGVDPAANLAQSANDRGLVTLCGLFDEQTATIARASMPGVDLVVARHVFCHVDDWKAFIFNLDKVCQRETLVVIEVPHAQDLLSKREFDTIYHEHLSYFTLRALHALLQLTPFRLQRVQHFPIHGGSLVVCLRRIDSVAEPDRSVAEWLEKEQVTQQDWETLQEQAQVMIVNLTSLLRTLAYEKEEVVGFGASAKSTVWINACGLTRKELRLVCDCTKGKWGRLCPGTDIPIVDEGALLRDLPDYAVCFAWNFRNEILERNSLWREKGGKFIFPVPVIDIV